MKQCFGRGCLRSLLVAILLLSAQASLQVQSVVAGPPTTGTIVFENIVDGSSNDRTDFTILYGLGVAIDGGCDYVSGPATVTISNHQHVPVNGLQTGDYCISQDPGAEHLWSLVQCFTVGQNMIVPIVDSMITLQDGMKVRCTFTNEPL